MEWEEVLHDTDRGLLCTLHKELPQASKKKAGNLVETTAKDFNGLFTKK